MVLLFTIYFKYLFLKSGKKLLLFSIFAVKYLINWKKFYYISLIGGIFPYINTVIHEKERP
jgi:hypothetical protein